MPLQPRRLLSALIGLVAMSLPLSVTAAASPAAAAPSGRTPVVSNELRLEIASGAARVVVTAWDAAGLAALDELGLAAERLRTAPIAITQLTTAQFETLSRDPRVRSLWHDEQLELALDTSTGTAGADQAQTRHGVDGATPSDALDGDVVVAVVDTGIDTLHPDLDGGKVLANYEVVDVAPEELQLVELPDTDDHGHGTHVASTIAGLDDDGGNAMDGVAPGAKLLGYSINANSTVSSTRALVAFDDIISKREAGMNVVAISNSWGGGPGDYVPDAPLSVITRRAFDAGVAVVFAAGNSGDQLNTASDECTMPWSICVGAITKDRTLAGFSSRGRPPVTTAGERPDGVAYSYPAGNHDRDLGQALDVGVFRPTLSAPGVDIIAACATQASADCDHTGAYGSQYQYMSGTSMATPHVSGVIALVAAARQHAVGSYDLDVHQLTDLLEGTATPLPGYELWEVGVGEVNALQAVEFALTELPAAELDIPTPNLGATPRFSGPPASSETQAVGPVAPNGWQTGEGIAEGTFVVPEGTGRVRTLLEWNDLEGNIYLRLYAPGAATATAESAGLLDSDGPVPVAGGPYVRGYRELFVNFPAAGEWRYEVIGRSNVPVDDATLTIEQWTAERPSLEVVETTTDGSTTQELSLSIPTAPERGNTRVATRGTAERPETLGSPTTFWLQSTAGTVSNTGTIVASGEPFDPHLQDAEPTGPDSKVAEVTMLANDAYAANFLTAFWRGEVDATIAGDVGLDLWVTHSGLLLDSSITVTLFDVPAGYSGEDEATVIGSGVASLPAAATPTHATVTVPDVFAELPAGRELVVQVTSQYIDSGHVQIHHGSSLHPSSITLPTFDGDLPAPGPDAPTGLTATDLVDGVQLDWVAADGATSYEVYRSSTATELGSLVGTTSEPTYTDATAGGTVAYYRVKAVGGERGLASDVVAGFPIRHDVVLEQKETGGAWEIIDPPTPECGETAAVGPEDGVVRVRTFWSVSTDYPTLTLEPTCSPDGPDAPTGDGKAAGAGELVAADGSGYEFAFHTEGRVRDGSRRGSAGYHLVLDAVDGDGPSVRITDVTATGALTGPCGDIAADGNTLEFHGTGTFDGDDATFRVCVSDVDDPRTDGDDVRDDQFVLECLAGCDFSTAGTTDGDRITEGNIRIVGTPTSQPAPSAGSGSSETGTTSTEDRAAVVAAGPAQGTDPVVTVRVFDDALAPLADAPVALHVTTALGTVTLTGLSSADGIATFGLDGLAVADLYATVGTIRSN